MNIKTIIISVFVVLALLVALAWMGYKNTSSALLSQDSNSAKSQLTASEILHDFGTISMANGKVDTTFKITNPTSKGIVLSSIVTSCMCTNAYIVKNGRERGPFGMSGHGGLVPSADETIKTGESLDIKVVYDPNAHGPAGVGSIDRIVELTDADGGMLHLEIKASVTP
ncbi:MAG: DUF1573 domain-containing protein [Patescibacteria group bacterium]